MVAISNDGKRFKSVEFRARGAVAELFYAQDPEVLIEGPAGTGKTRGVLEYLNHISILFPGVRLLLCRETRKSMTESVLVTLEDKVWGGAHPAMHGGASRANRQSYVWPERSSVVDGKEYRGRSEWILGGLENPDRLMSAEYDIAAIFEATETTAEKWEKVTSRLRNYRMPFQQAIADCNPAHPDHWLNRRAKSQMVRLLSRHEDNPSVRPEYLTRLSKLTGARRDRLYLGRWSAQEGAIWERFDQATHMIAWSQLPRVRGIKGEDPPLEMTLYWGAIDWGTTSPGCFQVWGCDQDGVAYRLHEIYHTRKNIDWWAAQIEPFCKMYPLSTIVADPSRRDLIEKMNDHLGRYRQRGADRLVREADNSIKAGIEVVDTMMMFDQRVRGPRVRFVRDALVQADPLLIDSGAPLCTEQEILSYHYGVVEEGKFNRDEPARGQADHGCDTTRYALMWLWKKNTERRILTPDFGIGTFGDILEHDKLLREIERRERRGLVL